MNVDVIIEDDRWMAVGLEPLAVQAAGAVSRRFELPAGCEAVVMGCDDRRIAALNGTFRDKQAATNVLSWPSAERGADRPGGVPLPPGDVELGDIAIAYDTCAHEARDQGKALSDHVTHLLVHGLLHLLGYDHTDDKDATLMEALETEILGNLGLSDPYGVSGA